MPASPATPRCHRCAAWFRCGCARRPDLVLGQVEQIHLAAGPGLQPALNAVQPRRESAMEMKAVEAPLSTVLHGQLNVLPLPPRDLLLARVIVESLDDDGYLRTPLEALRQLAEIDPHFTPQDLQIALKRVQSLQPAGVGARNVAECLQLQLPTIVCERQRELAQAIVANHLGALAARDVNTLARKLGVAVADVEQVCDRIRRLDPRPGWRYCASNIAYVVPDVIVKKTRGQWSVQLNPAIVPSVRLNRVVADLYLRHRTSDNTEMADHLQKARWTLRNVAQRFSTILDVANAIVRRQRHFLEFGAMAMNPLGLRELADEVGVHESPPCRASRTTSTWPRRVACSSSSSSSRAPCAAPTATPAPARRSAASSGT